MYMEYSTVLGKEKKRKKKPISNEHIFVNGTPIKHYNNSW